MRTIQDPVLSSSISLHISSLCVAFQDVLGGFVLSRSVWIALLVPDCFLPLVSVQT